MSWQLRAAFDVLGEPKGQPRPRSFARQVSQISKKTGRLEKAWKARVYDNATAEGWKGQIALAARPYLPSAPIEGPIRLGITFFFPRPARLNRKKDPSGPIPHIAKPDSDNAKKSVMDALTHIGMWRDDAQVCSWFGEKFYAARGQASGALIQIFTYQED